MALVFNMEDLYHRNALLNAPVDKRLLVRQVVRQVTFGPIGGMAKRMLGIDYDQSFTDHGLAFRVSSRVSGAW